MKRFINATNIKKITQATNIATAFLRSDSSLLRAMSEKNDWAYGAEGCGPRIISDVENGPIGVGILTYRPFNYFTSAVAMTNGSGLIHFNVYKVNKLHAEEIAATICHEYFHLLGYKHGTGITANYKTNDKCKRSVPYFASEFVAGRVWL